jgi:hypothetical protein
MTELNILAKASGFKDQEEMFTLIASVDLSAPEDMASFQKWQEKDGTKNGLLETTAFIKKDMSELFELVKKHSQEENYPCGKDSDNEEEENCPICDKIDQIASGLFVTNKGQCNWGHMLGFEARYPGVKIVRLEGDSFGWLIGGIKWMGKTYAYG